ncbi:hypothetical protein LCGC14_1999780 [marine sediment metagenome]|uniref:Uncharacterized protein n=1 Tax=marine sediment metagenome TaxID=412755 RepID=A0A0F9FRE6_9ZZZZ
MCCRLIVHGRGRVLREARERVFPLYAGVDYGVPGVLVEFTDGSAYFSLSGAGHMVTPESWVYAVKASVSLYNVARALGSPVELIHAGVPCDTKTIGSGGEADLSKLCWLGAPASKRKAEHLMRRSPYVRSHDKKMGVTE